MYFSFDLTDKLGTPNVVDIRASEFTESPTDRHCVRVEDFAPMFDLEGKDGPLPASGVWQEGWENFPLLTFDPDTRTFGKFDPYKCEALAAWHRRMQIAPAIAQDIKPATETKKIRKALEAVIKAIAETVPEIMDEAEIIDFLDYSATVKAKIERFPKDQDVDLRKLNMGGE